MGYIGAVLRGILVDLFVSKFFFIDKSPYICDGELRGRILKEPGKPRTVVLRDRK